MLETKLTPCASVLYHWILRRNPAGEKLKVDLQDFQAWTGEYREKPFSDRQICDALGQLKEFKLLAIARMEVTLDVKPQENFSLNERSPTMLLLAEDDLSSSDSIEDSYPSRKPSVANRFVELVKIVFGSLGLSATSVVLGLALAQTQPQTLTNPHPWSVLGERNISLSR